MHYGSSGGEATAVVLDTAMVVDTAVVVVAVVVVGAAVVAVKAVVTKREVWLRGGVIVSVAVPMAATTIMVGVCWLWCGGGYDGDCDRCGDGGDRGGAVVVVMVDMAWWRR